MLRPFVRTGALTILFALTLGSLPAQSVDPLTITTDSTLPAGEVGAAYGVNLVASGGTTPYTWSLASGVLPPGLSLTAGSGRITGTPTAAGTTVFAVEVTDSAARRVRKGFSLTVTAAALRILTASPLPLGKVRQPYSVRLSATGGTPPIANWSVVEGALPEGIALAAASGQINGIPAEAGSFEFTVQVADSGSATNEKAFVLTIDAEFLTILTESPLPDGLLGAPYTATLTASGGTRPFLWDATSDLPAGLSLNRSTGILSGAPEQSGDFEVSLRVTDAASGTVSETLSITIAAPVITLTLQGETGPTQQRAVTVSIAPVYPIEVSGELELTFTPDAVAVSDDPAIQFSTGGRSVSFTIPAQSARPDFGEGGLAVQTGTTAGEISVRLARLESGSVSIAPTPDVTQEFTIDRLPPTVSNVEILNRTASGFAVEITGFSTPREVTQALFRFTATSGGNLQTREVPVTLSAASGAWYSGADSGQFGSQFIYQQPFTTQGDINAIDSLSVTLTNGQGDSETVAADF